MTDYNKLVEALRERSRRENEWYEHGGDIIKAAADAIEALQAEVDTLKRTDSKRCQECLYLGQPVGEQMLPKRGEWIRHPEVKNIYGGEYIECPFCGEKYVVQYIADEKFCRNCGADMRQMEDTDDSTKH